MSVNFVRYCCTNSWYVYKILLSIFYSFLYCVTDVRAKSLGSNNPRNMVNATIEGLNSLKTVEDIAKLRGKKVEDSFSFYCTFSRF